MAKKQKKNKGVFQPGTPLEELEKKGIALSVSLPERKSVRYRCYRIRIGNDEGQWNDLKEMIENQFDADMTWDNFIEVWDIDKENPYKVVRL